ncbi:MAG TPA: SRPBCC domain-containing protein [Polyangiaceae bacterium]|jgi:hypothetical protein|nr:SRPBCC domain-containing protein [Polyangiaceae bacterium]
MTNPEKPVAQKSATLFSQDCAVSCDIAARPEKIWALLTDAHRFPSWNTTVTELGGEIALGNRLVLKVTLDPKRTFKPRVTKLEPSREMEWSDGFAPMFRGVRTFTLTPKPGGTTEFAMREVFSGVMLPMIRGSLPDFGPAFETFARDLKRAAEASAE